MNFLRIALIAAAVAAFSGCYSVNANLPGTLRNDLNAEDVEKIGELKIEKGHWFFIYGLIGAPPADFFAADIQKAVQAKGGDGVRNLRYESEDGCFDLIIGNCTFGIIAPRSYKLTGDIVRIRKAPLPGKPAKVAEPALPNERNAPVVAQNF